MSKRSDDRGYAAGWCIHYRAPSGMGAGSKEHDTCEAGVPYSKFYGTKFDTRPCFLDDKTGESKPDAQPCEHLRRPTKEEIALHEEWVEAHMNRAAAVMMAIEPWRKTHKGKSARDVIECPICKGRLHLSIAAYNGHVHGQCETADCISWIE